MGQLKTGMRTCITASNHNPTRETAAARCLMTDASSTTSAVGLASASSNQGQVKKIRNLQTMQRHNASPAFELHHNVHGAHGVLPVNGMTVALVLIPSTESPVGTQEMTAGASQLSAQAAVCNAPADCEVSPGKQPIPAVKPTTQSIFWPTSGIIEADAGATNCGLIGSSSFSMPLFPHVGRGTDDESGGAHTSPFCWCSEPSLCWCSERTHSNTELPFA